MWKSGNPVPAFLERVAAIKTKWWRGSNYSQERLSRTAPDLSTISDAPAESQDSGYLYFCFRWLLIRFKREFSFHDILRLWEVMWTGLPCQNFHLLLCCAILDSEKSKMMEEKFGFNEILKHVNELSMKLDVEEILQKGESIWLQMNKCQGLPQSVINILALESKPRDRCDSSTESAAAAPPVSGALHRGDRACANSNGHLRAMDSQHLSKVAFMS